MKDTLTHYIISDTPLERLRSEAERVDHYLCVIADTLEEAQARAKAFRQGGARAIVTRVDVSEEVIFDSSADDRG